MATAPIKILLASVLSFSINVTIALAQSIIIPGAQADIANLPHTVRADIGNDLCLDSSAPVREPGFATRRNVFGNGNVDIVLNYSHSLCSGYPSCGTGGCFIKIYALQLGKYKKVFQEIVRGITFGRAHGKPSINLAVHGMWCGQAGVVDCRDTLYWNGSSFCCGKPYVANHRSPAAAAPAAAPAPRWVAIPAPDMTPPSAEDVRKAGLTCDKLDSVNGMSRRLDGTALAHISCDGGDNSAWLSYGHGKWERE